MEDWRIVEYEGRWRRRWDDFVDASRNATFLFKRGYMDYHSDRFADFSMMAFKGERLLALLPANITPDGVLHSHQGLTYGGWILPVSHLDCVSMSAMWRVWLEYCREAGVKAIDYKPLPYIYSRMPSQEDRYLLFQGGARLDSVTISSAISLADNPGFNALQRRHLRRASALGVEIRETDDVRSFMDLTSRCLAERHSVRPVHTPEEMELLKSRFPEEIRIFGAFADGVMHAGVMVYDASVVAHCQYIATTPRGREENMLTLLFSYLINEAYVGKSYFDFGISTEEGGKVLNEGLYRQKASLGASGVECPRYTIEL